MKWVHLPVCVLLLLGWGCGENRSSADRAAERGVLIVGNNSEPQSLDPHKATAVADGKIIGCLLEGLVRPDPAGDANPLPGMAESWEANDRSDRWVFHLRRAVWSDGQPVTSADFSYAYRRLLHPQFGGRYAEMLYPLKNARAYNEGAVPWEEVGVKTPDEHTLVLELAEPMPHLPLLLLHYTWFPLPHHVLEAQGGMLDRRCLWTHAEHWVGNGAYVLREHRFNDFLEVSANPRYYRAAEVNNRAVRFLPVVNGFTETRMFADGKLHLTNNVPPEMIDVAKRRSPGAYCEDAYYCTIFYRINMTRPPLDDARVRRALAMAVDREELVRDVVRGAGRPAEGFTPPGAGYDTPRMFPAMPDGERRALARRLLAEAGYPGGRGFPVLELMTSSREVQKVMAEAIQAMWQKNLGIHVEIRSCEWTAYKAAQQNMQYDLSSSSWSGDYLDPATFVDLWRRGGGNNSTGWGSAAFDARLAEAHSAPTLEKRMLALRSAEAEMLREMPIIPLYWANRTYLKAPCVQGWHPLLLDNHPLDAVRVSAAGGNHSAAGGKEAAR